MLTLNMLDAIDADRLHRKLSGAWRVSEEGVARRRYRLLARVYLHLHKALMRSHQNFPTVEHVATGNAPLSRAILRAASR